MAKRAYEPVCHDNLDENTTVAVNEEGYVVLAALDATGEGTIIPLGCSQAYIDSLIDALTHMKEHMPPDSPRVIH